MEIIGMSVKMKTTYSVEWKNARKELIKTLKDQKDMTEEDVTASKAKMIASVVMSWTGFEENGKSLRCVPSTVERILTEYPWLLEQLDIALGNEKNFYQSTATS
jgi:hypothetical protein